MRHSFLRAGTALWLVLAALAQVVGLVAAYVVFVRTRTGQLVDAAALFGTGFGRARVGTLLETVLGVVSVTSLLLVTIVIAGIALTRRRPWLAAAVVATVVLANGATQLLKNDLLTRPDIDRYPLGLPINSMPSGHATVAMSLAVAATLAVGPRWRGTVAVVGAAYASVTGVATLSAGWHRPSDSVASFLVVGTCAALVALVLSARFDGGTGAARLRGAETLLVLTALVALVAAGLALAVTTAWVSSPDDLFGRGRLVLAYAGGAAGIVGAAAVVMVVVLRTTAAISDAAAPARLSGSRA